jgi:FKBP-type peptidyl-prolyl cis-trans isomerase SlyD
MVLLVEPMEAFMRIEPNTVVTIAYNLRDPEGELIDSSEGRAPLSFLFGQGRIIPGVEEALQDKTAGDALAFTVEPEKAYGLRDESLLQVVPRDVFASAGIADPEEGMRFEVTTEEGDRMITIVEVAEEDITVDGNHPLAGLPLEFEVTVLDVREATLEERTHGHVHGPDGHHH